MPYRKCSETEAMVGGVLVLIAGVLLVIGSCTHHVLRSVNSQYRTWADTEWNASVERSKREKEEKERVAKEKEKRVEYLENRIRELEAKNPPALEAN